MLEEKVFVRFSLLSHCLFISHSHFRALKCTNAATKKKKVDMKSMGEENEALFIHKNSFPSFAVLFNERAESFHAISRHVLCSCYCCCSKFLFFRLSLQKHFSLFLAPPKKINKSVKRNWNEGNVEANLIFLLCHQ